MTRAAAPQRKGKALEGLAQRFTHEKIEKGVAASVVGEIVEADILSRSEIARLVPPRTLARRISGRARLKAEEADAIGRLLRLTAEAERVFGDSIFARKWLRSKNPALKNRAPIVLAKTDAGAREVETVLTRIAYGDYS